MEKINEARVLRATPITSVSDFITFKSLFFFFKTQTLSFLAVTVVTAVTAVTVACLKSCSRYHSSFLVVTAVTGKGEKTYG
jgi:hypothetical protein